MKNIVNQQNEFFIECHNCSQPRLLAYWDEELEAYIYLCETEKPLCLECSAKNTS